MRTFFSTVATALLLATTSVHAQDVSFGGPVAGTNAFPFTNYGFASPNRYQQLYTSAPFGGPVFIDAIRFSNSASVAGGHPGSIAPGDYLVRLAVTGRAENGLTTNFESNVGGFGEIFFNGTIGDGTLRIVGSTPYLFDPSRGNLLLDLLVLWQDDVGFDGLDYSTSTTDGTSRAYRTFSQGDAPPIPHVDAFGLNTTFETRPAVTATPEPESLALVAGGLGLLVVFVRRRRA